MIKTWICEAVFVILFLIASLYFKNFEENEIICSLAVLFTFLTAQVTDRMHEKQAQKENPDVECYRFSLYYYIMKESLWILYFFKLKAYAALVGAFIFLLYPLWRKLYRYFKPLKYTRKGII